MKTKGKIYITGRIIGEKFVDAMAKFHEAEQILKARGFEVINPIKLLSGDTVFKKAVDALHPKAMQYCTALYVLPCSVESFEAKRDLDYALKANMDVYYELENVEANGATHDVPC